MICIRTKINYLCLKLYSGFYKEYQCEENEENLKSAVEKIMEEILQRTKCIVIITDSVYRTLVDITHVQGSTIISKYEVRYEMSIY